MTTFEQTCKAQTPQQQRLAEVQASFAPTVAVLRDLRTTIHGSQASWGQRWAAIAKRRQEAFQHGARVHQLDTIARELCGDGYLHGILSTLLPQIDEMMHRLTHFPPELLEYPHTWKPWANCPSNFRGLIGTVERHLTTAEKLVADGGALEQQVAYVKGLPQDTASARPAETGGGSVTVEV